MKLVLFIWMGLVVLAAPVHADSPPQCAGSLVADEGLDGHIGRTWTAVWRSGSLMPWTRCLRPCPVGQQEFLLFQLLGELKSSEGKPGAAGLKLRAQAAKGATMAEVEGGRFPLQLPPMTSPAEAGWC